MRYFYTDHPAVAWMATHFGMKYLTESGGESSFVTPIYFHEPENGDSYFGKLYIAPDSLHLLKSQLGDLIIQGDLCGAGKLEQSHNEYQNHINLDYGREVWQLEEPYKIIQRNGIVFMRPESEE